MGQGEGLREGNISTSHRPPCHRRKNPTSEIHLSSAQRGTVSDDFSLCQPTLPRRDPDAFEKLQPWSPRDICRECGRAEKVLPWAGPLLLSCSRLLGWRELMTSGQHCRETSLARSSSSAKRSRAEGTACRHRGERREEKRG